MWQIWMSASWEMQCKAPAQMHFIIAAIITDDSLEMWDSCLLGAGRISLFLLCMFHLCYFSNASYSVWKYRGKFPAFIGAYTMIDLTIP